MNNFSIGLWCVTKSRLYTATGDNQLSGWIKKKLQALLKAKLAPNRVMATVWSPTANRVKYGFLNLGETITSEKYAQAINEMHWKLQCLQPVLVNRKGPVFLQDSARLHVTHQCFKSWINWNTTFCLIHHIHLTSCQPTITSSSISTTFCRENASISNMSQNMLSKSSLNPKVQICML